MAALGAEIVAAVDDLFFGVKIQEAARKLNLPVALARSPEEASTLARERHPALLIVDLQAETCRPLEIIRRIKADPDLRATPILGYVAHVREDLMAAASGAGCDELLPRSAFSARLPEILRRFVQSSDGPLPPDAVSGGMR